jgi:hypothetical protein
MAKARGKRSRVMGVAMALGLGAAGCRSAPVNVPPGDDPRDGLGSAARAPAIDAAHAAPPAPPPDATPAPTFDAPPPIELRALADLPRATWKATPVEPGLARAVSACGLPFGKLQRASADGPACRPPLTDAGGDALQACVDTANQAAVTSATERLLRREGATNLGEVDVFVCMDPAAASTSVTTPVCTPDMLRVDDDFESGWWLPEVLVGDLVVELDLGDLDDRAEGLGAAVGLACLSSANLPCTASPRSERG